MLRNIFRPVASNLVFQRSYAIKGVARGPSVASKRTIPGVTHVIAVASGKGGVGKSTLAVNIAMALHALGFRIGLLDADIYGPSIPIMMNLRDKQPMKNENNLIIPLENYGLKVMSIGNLIDPDKAMIWRGPIVASAVEQLLHKVQNGTI